MHVYPCPYVALLCVFMCLFWYEDILQALRGCITLLIPFIMVDFWLLQCVDTPRATTKPNVFTWTKIQRFCFDWLALWTRKTPHLTSPRFLTYLHTHACKQMCCRLGIPLIFPGISLFSHCNFHSSLLFLFGLMNADPRGLLLRDGCRGADHHLR